MTPETLAQRFHEAYERLAPHFGYETRKESAVPWDDVPEQNKALMVAVADEVLSPLVETARVQREALRDVEQETRDGLSWVLKDIVVEMFPASAIDDGSGFDEVVVALKQGVEALRAAVGVSGEPTPE